MMVVIGMMILYLLLVENFILAISWKTHTDPHEVPGPNKNQKKVMVELPICSY